MTGKQVYACPFCDGYTAGSIGSVSTHITAKTDPAHKGKSGQAHRDEITPVDAGGAEQAEQEQAQQEHAAEQAEQHAQPVEFPAAEQAQQERAGEQAEQAGSACCEHPDLEGEAGDVYRLEGGGIVQLEAGDRICVNCDEIHE